MPIKKGLKPYEKRTDDNRHVRPRISVVEEIAMLTAPVWNSKKKKFESKMTIAEACSEVWISDMTFRNWRQQDPKLQKYFEEVKLSRKEMVHSMITDAALQNVLEVIWWWVKVRAMDKANLSMRYLEKTDPDMNPSLKVDVDSTNKSLVLWMTTSEMERRAMEIAVALWINVKQYGNTWPTHTEDAWESVWTTKSADPISSELSEEPTIS